ncbi:hypothetical protein [Cupriavidus sp. UBA2534]|uniref:hypothetical protein n=1 Tax=Cupriavidus sp. UBA2534 TaxID=1946399 RepID=UPI000E8528CD|nr:hypothetical protein [Cupriavidus sp. UBA2534]HBO78681.1 hypothetical protein [Cupriavidus sp.]
MEITAATYEMPDGSQEVEITHKGQTTRFTASDLSDYIAALAQVRESLRPPVRTQDPQAGETVQAIADPRWWMSSEAFVGGALLQLRHPGLGWLAFALPLQSLQALHAEAGKALVVAENQAASQRQN